MLEFSDLLRLFTPRGAIHFDELLARAVVSADAMQWFEEVDKTLKQDGLSRWLCLTHAMTRLGERFGRVAREHSTLLQW